TSASKLAPIAEETQRLARKLMSITQGTAALGDLGSNIDGVYQRVSASAVTVDRVLAARELTDETAELLHRVQNSLPELPELKLSLAESVKTQTDIQLRTILWEDRLQNIGRSQRSDREFLEAQLINQNEIAELASTNTELIQSMQTLRRELLSKLIEASGIDLERRTNTNIALRKTIALTEDLKTRLDRRLLWLKTDASSATQTIKNIPAGLSYVLNTDHWKDVSVKFRSQIFGSPIWLLCLLGIPILLRGLRPLMKRRLASLASRVGNPMTSAHPDNVLVTPAALLLSTLIAAPFAVLLASAGLVLSSHEILPNFTKALSMALILTGCIFFVLFTFKTMCRENGLLGSHLGWSPLARQTFSRHLKWFTPVISTATFFFIIAIYENIPVLRYGLGVLAFMSSSIAISSMIFVFFRPKRGVAASIVLETPPSAFIKFIFPLLVIIPLGLGMAPLFGYFETAVELQDRIFKTGILAIVITVFYGLLIRTFNVLNDRYLLRLEGQKETQDLIDNQAKLEADQSGEARPATPIIAEKAHLSVQIQKTLFSISVLIFLYGLWNIWGSLLPALGVADDITLWTQVSMVDGEEVLHPVTLSRLFIAGLILFGSLMAARNVNTILELVAFNRLNIDSGTKYAAITILGYILVGSGVVISLALLGLDWSKLQWVVAALGVGIGFGLQEIIANFISGIIILFERPVRVGDIVTINGLSGTVNNIKIRATTITDFDNREVLLPNKFIITGEVTNWTLNNSVTRLIVNIGVAYGSDVPKVRQIFTDILSAHPDVLKDPAPTVFFTAHGDSSLDFELRLFVSAPFQRLPTTNDVNTAINAALAANNIEIPFPQRDVNMRQVT
ncbi:mechanosensitive ion channel, partial [Hellea sp.]|nr:mechanosensitive ion channel [Hellea sp.]